ncbi:MAG: NAD(P)H-hydrate dehydratase [Euryarchaeota archaeon]|nr:NAD(P)H-hydrate dehydratase [Euryarchaeota archaeon]
MLTASEMRVLDRNAEWLGIKILDLMENAGRAVADAVLKEMGGRGKRILIVCGTGNNGGDGLTAVRYLKPEADVTVLLAKPPSDIATPEALANFERVKDAVHIVVADAKIADRMREADVIVDALLGIGVEGDVREPYASLIRAMNGSGKPILSVDVPSGFGANVAVKPTVTVSLHDAKAGMTDGNSGKILVAPIGIPPEVERTIGPGEFVYYPHPKEESHKGQNGRLLVVGGGPFTGAPAFVAQAAYRIGVDAVHIATPASTYPIIASLSPNFIVHPLSDRRLVTDDVLQVLEIAGGMDAIAIGPGLGTEMTTQEAVRNIVTLADLPLVLDADAFTALAGHADILRGKRGVMTPHAREFEVVSGEAMPPNLDGRAQVAKAFAAKTGLTILLKGPIDVVTDGERAKFNRTGNPGMTVGGTGDVLAGLVAGLVAKGVAPFDAARIAAFTSGYAGDLAFEDLSYGMTAYDVAEHVPRVLKKFL